MIHLISQLTPETTVTVTLTVGGTITAALVIATWRAANFLRDVRDELKGLRSDVRESWTRREQERWANELERQNRKLPLKVPPVPDRGVVEETG